MDLFDLPTHLPNEQASSSKPASTSEPGDQTNIESMTVSIESKSATAEGSSHESSASPIYIPGTTIKLETDEDIQKWIAERRKNWPSTKNLERKQQEKHSDKKRKLQEEPSTSSPTTKKPRQICRFYQNNKSCRFGDNCKNMHESETDFKMINNMKVKVPKSFENNYYVKENASENMSLYKMLVKKDQFELENDKFIEFLYYLDKKGLIKHTFNDIPT